MPSAVVHPAAGVWIKVGPVVRGQFQLLAKACERESSRNQLRSHIRRSKRIAAHRIVASHTLIIAGKEMDVVRLARMNQCVHVTEPHAAIRQCVEIWRIGSVADDLRRGTVLLNHDEDVVVTMRCGIQNCKTSAETEEHQEQPRKESRDANLYDKRSHGLANIRLQQLNHLPRVVTKVTVRLRNCYIMNQATRKIKEKASVEGAGATAATTSGAGQAMKSRDDGSVF